MLLLTSIQVAACGYVLFVCIMVLNAMSKGTRFSVRLSYLCMIGGAFSGIVMEPTWHDCLFAVGVAFFLACNERTHHASQPKSFS